MPNMLNLDSAIFYTKNLEKVIDFYRNVIGLEIEYQQSDNFVSFIFPNKVRLGIKKATEEREQPGRQTIFIEVEEIEEVYNGFKKLNLDFYKELTSENWAKNFAILDPDGNKLQFIQRRRL